MTSLAPAAKQILVYEGPNTDPGLIDVYQRIATDDLAQGDQHFVGRARRSRRAPAIFRQRHQIFMQMAAQGQTIFAASGDSGAFDDGTSLSVDDPASQPYVTGAGGTTLATNADHSYVSETTWWNGSIGSGGGISACLADSELAGGTRQRRQPRFGDAMRNVPDVALNADPATGYAIFVAGNGRFMAERVVRLRFGRPSPRSSTNSALRPDSALGFRESSLSTRRKKHGLRARFPRHRGRQHERTLSRRCRLRSGDGLGIVPGANLLSDLSGVLPAPSPYSFTEPVPTPSPSPSPSPSQLPRLSGGCSRTHTRRTEPSRLERR